MRKKQDSLKRINPTEQPFPVLNKKTTTRVVIYLICGRNRIRTCGTLLYTSFPRMHFKPLSHSSLLIIVILEERYCTHLFQGCIFMPSPFYVKIITKTLLPLCYTNIFYLIFYLLCRILGRTVFSRYTEVHVETTLETKHLLFYPVLYPYLRNIFSFLADDRNF